MAEEVIFKIIEGGLAGEEFVFEEKGLCLIGRSADCALQIPKEKDMKISRRHCLLILDPPHVRIRDLGSRNGTTVNGELLDPGTVTEVPERMTPVDRILKDGDIISIGETVLSLEVPSEKPPMVIPASAGLKQIPPATKVIKLSKPSPTRTGTLIPKSTPVSTGFFAPPTSNVNTSSRTIAMTEAISREELANRRKQEETSSSLPVAKVSDKGQTAIIPPKRHGISVAGPLAPPPPSPAPAAPSAGPLAPPPAERRAPVVLGKKIEPAPVTEDVPVPEEPRRVIANVNRGTSGGGTEIIQPKPKNPIVPETSPAGEAPAGEEPRRILKAKLVKPGSTQAGRVLPKKLNSHMQTVVMDAKEFESLDDIVAQPEAEEESKPQKRVTKFRIKGPS